MKLMRVGPSGVERPVAVLDDGRPVDLSAVVADVDGRLLSDEGLQRLGDSVHGGHHSLPEVDVEAERIGPPLSGIGKIVCVGLNYREHAREAGLPVPSEPILFLKAPDTVVGPFDQVLIPPLSAKTDYEVELAVVIGRAARYLSDEDDPMEHVAGYAVSNDVSEREYQLERGGQWDKGKNCETFNPLGPWFVTRDEVPDPQRLGLRLSVNGESRQRSSTADMIFTVAEIVRYVSQFMTLHPGDVINTGTPPGVGSGFAPGRFLDDGDVVELSIDGLGTQRQTFRRYQREVAS